MPNNSIQDRACGAVMGAFIGEALGVGPHWYYNLDELHRDYGNWISDYTDPKPGRYHYGLKAGQLSQPGFILKLLLHSLVDRGGYDNADFCHRMDDELFPLLDGTPVSGPGHYPASPSVRHGGDASCTKPHGRKRATVPIPRKPSSAPLPLPCAMHSSHHFSPGPLLTTPC